MSITNYKKILNVVGVAVAVSALMFVGCGGSGQKAALCREWMTVSGGGGLTFGSDGSMVDLSGIILKRKLSSTQLIANQAVGGGKSQFEVGTWSVEGTRLSILPKDGSGLRSVNYEVKGYELHLVFDDGRTVTLIRKDKVAEYNAKKAEAGK